MPKHLTTEQYKALFASNGSVAPELKKEVTIIKYLRAWPPEVEAEPFEGYTRKFIEEPWQTEDINHLLEYEGQGTANWSEMGAYKTSTGLWYVDRKIQQSGLEVKHPSILIISTKAGKGTFLEAVPEILPGYTILNIETQGLSLYQNGHMLKIPGIKAVPEAFDFPVVCLAHYDIFSRSNRGKYETDAEGSPLIIDGEVFEKPWTQADHIINRKWDIVWCDEFHRLKDRNSRWTVNIKKIKTTVGRHGSTGTGFINRPDEIWSLLNWLDRRKYGGYHNFVEEYCEIDMWSGYAQVVGCKDNKRDEFRDLVREIGVRRTLDEVHKNIPKPIYTPVVVDLNKEQRKMYDAIKMELQTLDKNGVPLYAANVLSLLQRLRQICVGTPEVVLDYYDPIQDRRVQKIKLREPSSKIDEVMNILEGLRWDEDDKEPLVVFSCFKDPLDLLKGRLDKHNNAVSEMGLPEDFYYRYIHLDVGDSDEVRYRKWKEDFASMKYRIFMSTLQLGGESINLSPARHVVFLDRSWSPKDNAQGVGRIRRPGQTRQPVVIHINARNTTDQYIEHVNTTKQGWFNEIFGEE